MKKRTVKSAFQWAFILALIFILLTTLMPEYTLLWMTALLTMFGMGYVMLISHMVSTGKVAMKGSKKKRRAFLSFFKEGPKTALL